MDITSEIEELNQDIKIVNLTSNIKKPKYSLYKMNVPEDDTNIKFNTDITSIVVINGELEISLVKEKANIYKKFQGIHVLDPDKLLTIKGSTDCVILIGSTSDLKIDTETTLNRDYVEINLIDFSSYKVNKPWGFEIWFTENIDNFPYALKNIHMEKDFQSSLQSHKFKSETNVVVHGEAKVLYGKDAPEDISESIDINSLEEKIYKPMDGWSNKVNELHRVIAHTTYDAIEISTPELDDVIRWADDSDRESGKIDSEHND